MKWVAHRRNLCQLCSSVKLFRLLWPAHSICCMIDSIHQSTCFHVFVPPSVQKSINAALKLREPMEVLCESIQKIQLHCSITMLY